MIEWIRGNEVLLWWLAVGSIVVLVLTLVALPLLLIRIPSDHFLSSKRRGLPWAERQPAIRWSLRIASNLFGIALVLLGIALLVLPGQGILTILAGFMVMNFPGKYRVERWIVGKPAVRGAIDRLRRIAGRPPLILEESAPFDNRDSDSRV
jgi:hypothetical protein